MRPFGVILAQLEYGRLTIFLGQVALVSRTNDQPATTCRTGFHVAGLACFIAIARRHIAGRRLP
jgi:hypothetical protein